MTAPTLADLEAMIAAAGGTVLRAASWEDEHAICASSVETYGPGTYNHPRYGLVFHKSTGWLQADLNGVRADRKYAAGG